MKVSVKYANQDFKKKNKEFIHKFISFLQKEYPVKHDVKISFLENREGEMTTGSRKDDHLIKILAKNRLNRDIMRTLAHEWVHEYQLTNLKRKHGPDIGGKNENEANSVAGILIKKFEKSNPDSEDMMYE